MDEIKRNYSKIEMIQNEWGGTKQQRKQNEWDKGGINYEQQDKVLQNKKKKTTGFVSKKILELEVGMMTLVSLQYTETRLGLNPKESQPRQLNKRGSLCLALAMQNTQLTEHYLFIHPIVG